VALIASVCVFAGVQARAQGVDPVLWGSWSSADYLVVAPNAFLPTLAPLVAHRTALGHKVAVVSTEEIYGQGPDSDLLQEFISALADHTGNRLKFVLLAGDAPPDGVGMASQLAIPAGRKAKMKYGWRWRPGDMFPTDDVYSRTRQARRLAVGRIPAETVEQLAGVVAKTIAYETRAPGSDWQRRLAVFTGPARYGKAIDTIVEGTGRHLLDNVIPYDFDLQFLFAKPDQDYAYPPQLLDGKLMSTLGRGALIAAYVGHGQTAAFDSIRYRGRRYPIGSVLGAAELNVAEGNPFFLSLACLTGAYDTRYGRAIGEMLAVNRSGAIGVWAATRVVHPYANALYAQAFVDTFLIERPRTIGEGLLKMQTHARTKRKLLVEAMLQTHGGKLLDEHEGLYQFFGDPASRLRYPAEASVTLSETSVEPLTQLKVAVRSSAVRSGTATVTLETQRSRIRGKLVPYSEIQTLPPAEATAIMAMNYDRATQAVLETHTVTLKDGRADLTLTAPVGQGAYAVKVFILGAKDAAAGHQRFDVASNGCAPVPMVRQLLSRPGGQIVQTRMATGLDLDGKGSPVAIVPDDLPGMTAESTTSTLWVRRGRCFEKAGTFKGLRHPGES